MSEPHDPSQAPAGMPEAPQCFRHPGRETWIRCQRCERPVCPDCMTPAAVGFQCPDCVKQGAKQTRSGLTPYGGKRSGDPRLTTIALIGINLAVFVAVLFTGRRESSLVDTLLLRPAGICVSDDGGFMFPHATAAAACDTPLTTWLPGLSDGAWWQLLSHGFVHVDFLHIAFNCLALWMLAPGLEQVFGRARFLAIYLGATLAATAAIMWFSDPLQGTLGASGGVFGLLGAMLVVVWKIGGDLRSIGALLAVNVFITVTVPNISWQGHLGGFVGGALLAAVIVFAPKGERRALIQWLGVAAVVLISLALVAVRVLALR